MESNQIASYQKVKIDIFNKEREIESALRLIEKKENVNLDRPNDYGQRGFGMNIIFDEVNIAAFSEENVKKIIRLLLEYTNLRNMQKKHELDILPEEAIKKEIMESIS
jgi:hypothetical protein